MVITRCIRPRNLQMSQLLSFSSICLQCIISSPTVYKNIKSWNLTLVIIITIKQFQLTVKFLNVAQTNEKQTLVLCTSTHCVNHIIYADSCSRLSTTYTDSISRRPINLTMLYVKQNYYKNELKNTRNNILFVSNYVCSYNFDCILIESFQDLSFRMTHKSKETFYSYLLHLTLTRICFFYILQPLSISHKLQTCYCINDVFSLQQCIACHCLIQG